MPSASLSVPALSGAGARARAQNTMVGDMVWLFCVLLVLTLLGRAAFVFPLSLAHNWYAREQLSFKEMVVIWRAPAPPCPMTSLVPVQSSCFWKAQDAIVIERAAAALPV